MSRPLPRRNIQFSAELEDIMEDISKQNWQKVITNNLKEILKREGLWEKELEIVFISRAFAEIDLTNDSYQFDFEIWLRLTLIKGQIASGTCYGKGIEVEDPLGNLTGELNISNMTLEIMEGYKHLKDVSGREKVNFT